MDEAVPAPLVNSLLLAVREHARNLGRMGPLARWEIEDAWEDYQPEVTESLPCPPGKDGVSRGQRLDYWLPLAFAALIAAGHLREEESTWWLLGDAPNPRTWAEVEQPRPTREVLAAWLWADRVPPVESSPCPGKWLVRVSPSNIDDVWAKLAKATKNGLLGPRSKTSTAGSFHRSYVVCVYTQDRRDESDVSRVLTALRALGFPGRLSYKSDAATMSGLYGAESTMFVAQAGSHSAERRLPN